MIRRLLIRGAAAAVCWIVPPAMAQGAFLGKTIKIVVPQPSGSGPNTIDRLGIAQ